MDLPIEIKCPKCDRTVIIDLWKMEHSHKILCPECNEFFNLTIKGQHPKEVLESSFKKAGLNLKWKK
ncbi:MAG: hypothetical protein WC462_00060 [archaeon]